MKITWIMWLNGVLAAALAVVVMRDHWRHTIYLQPRTEVLLPDVPPLWVTNYVTLTNPIPVDVYFTNYLPVTAELDPTERHIIELLGVQALQQTEVNGHYPSAQEVLDRAELLYADYQSRMSRP